eukprot:g20984.t1
MGHEQNIPSSSEQLGRLSEPMGSLPQSSIEETAESQVDMVDIAASIALLPEKEDEFLLRSSRCKRQGRVQYTVLVSKAESAELDL